MANTIQILIAEVPPDAQNNKEAIRGSCQLGTDSRAFQEARVPVSHSILAKSCLVGGICIAKWPKYPVSPRLRVTVTPSFPLS